jgi:ribosome recycling factor
MKKEQCAKMDKVVSDLHTAFGTIRTGRASLSLVDKLRVDAYGSQVPLRQIASLSTPDARTIAIQPFDQNQVKAVEKAIAASDIGITPSNDGRVIRLSIPPLTEDRRKDLVKLAKKYAEEHRVTIRQIRHQFNDEIKRMQKNGDISEDIFHTEMDHFQKTTNDYIAKVDAELAKKEAEVMEV